MAIAARGAPGRQCKVRLACCRSNVLRHIWERLASVRSRPVRINEAPSSKIADDHLILRVVALQSHHVLPPPHPLRGADWQRSEVPPLCVRAAFHRTDNRGRAWQASLRLVPYCQQLSAHSWGSGALRSSRPTQRQIPRPPAKAPTGRPGQPTPRHRGFTPRQITLKVASGRVSAVSLVVQHVLLELQFWLDVIPQAGTAGCAQEPLQLYLVPPDALVTYSHLWRCVGWIGRLVPEVSLP
jgi:hypothetical protein